jgi:hypothetical protein
MALIRWNEGPRDFGCAYHKRGVCRFERDDIVVDLFVMPSIQGARPIALTIGRYHDYKPTMEKQKWHFVDPDERAGRIEDVSVLFDRLQLPADIAADLADEVDQYVFQESASLKVAMGARS